MNYFLKFFLIIIALIFSYNFSYADSSLGSTGVALSINIGLQKGEYLNELNQVKSVTDIIEENRLESNKIYTNADFIETNINNIIKYENILNIKLINLLESTEDREITINSYIKLLNYYQVKITDKINFLQTEYNTVVTKESENIINLDSNKSAIGKSFSDLNSDNLNINADRYVVLKEQEASIKIKKTLIQNFILNYNNLNKKSETLKQAIIDNKEALIKNITITFPENGENELRELGLIE